MKKIYIQIQTSVETLKLYKPVLYMETIIYLLAG